MSDDKTMTSVPCLVCGKGLENLDPEGNQPSRGIEFTTPGHYGTAEFDPMDGTRLAVNVCDGCVVAARRAGRVLHVTLPQRATAPTYEVWSHDGDDEPTKN